VKILNQNISTKMLVTLMAVAYIFSVLVRLIWVVLNSGDPTMLWNDQLILTTNDGYYFATGVQNVLDGSHNVNPRMWTIWNQGTILFSALLVKLSPFSLETTLFYMPIFLSSIIAIPLVLIGNLYGKPYWGFCAALLGTIAHSYYNRTMAGYYDTDMFSIWLPIFALYFMLRSIEKSSWNMLFYSSIILVFYAFVYTSSKGVIFGLGLSYIAYKLWYHRRESFTYKALLLVIVSMIPFGDITSPYEYPYGFLVQLAILVVLYMIFRSYEFSRKSLIIASIIGFLVLLYFGNIFGIISAKILSYTTKDNTNLGLHFYGVIHTVQEASGIDFMTFANRISGSIYGLVFAVAGYGILVYRHRAFLIALPLLGIGSFALMGGLRFTVYATPIAALGASYLVFYISERIALKSQKIAFIVVSMVILLIPNIYHVLEYDMPTVLTHNEISDLEKLRAISNPKDVTVTWWDYGYPVWFYSGTSTLIDGGKHHHENFVVSQALLTSSPILASNLIISATDEYYKLVDIMKKSFTNKASAKEQQEAEMYKKLGTSDGIDMLLKNAQSTQLDSREFLASLESKDYKLQPKSRDIYLYLPYRMMELIPTIAQFSDIDLESGASTRDRTMYTAQVSKQDGGIVTLNNGIIVDTQSGAITISGQKIQAKTFVVASKDIGKNQVTEYDTNGEYAIVYMEQYKQFVIMDSDTFDSMYTQMFMLGNYDKSRFELVISSPYSKIYRLK